MFHSFPPTLNGIKLAASQIQFPDETRKLLVEHFQSTYNSLPPSHATDLSIEKLSNPSCLTICTGQQLGLLTGPLFTLYKIIHTIALSREMEKELNCPLVPIFWLAGEDHDIEEIKQVHIFRNNFSWNTPQTGPVGRMSTAGIETLIEQIIPLFGNTPKISDVVKNWANFYHHNTLGRSTLELFHYLFNKSGLLILDADTPALKSLFTPWMEEDILREKWAEPLQEQTHKLGAFFEPPVIPKTVNFFYMENGSRKRIPGSSEGGNNISASDIYNQPENFSPNVCLRPLYQQVILPNIVYIGGQTEVKYWLQLKLMFDKAKVFFPVVLPRHQASILSSHRFEEWEKMGLSLDDIFKDVNQNIKKYIQNQEEWIPNPGIKNTSQILFELIEKETRGTDENLISQARALTHKLDETIEQYLHKLEKIHNKKHETAVNKIKNINSLLFPEGIPQERIQNILAYYDDTMLDTLLTHFGIVESRQFLLLT